MEKNNEEAMKAALAEHGPLLVIVDAIDLAFYSSGIISGKGCDHGTVNHAVRNFVFHLRKSTSLKISNIYIGCTCCL